MNRLKKLISEEFGNSQAALSKSSGVSTSQINQYLSGYRNIGEKAARKIEAGAGKQTGWLDQDQEKSNVSDAVIRGGVPLISWVQAGHWTDVIDNLAPNEGERIETSARVKAHTYALRVHGDSMEPKFPEGAILIIEPEEDPTPGKFVIVRQNSDTEATFKQLVQDGGRLYLKPLNQRYPILELREDAVFCGVVKRVEMDV